MRTSPGRPSSNALLFHCSLVPQSERPHAALKASRRLVIADRVAGRLSSSWPAVRADRLRCGSSACERHPCSGFRLRGRAHAPLPAYITLGAAGLIVRAVRRAADRARPGRADIRRRAASRPPYVRPRPQACAAAAPGACLSMRVLAATPPGSPTPGAAKSRDAVIRTRRWWGLRVRPGPDAARLERTLSVVLR